MIDRVWTCATPEALSTLLWRERARSARAPNLDRIGREMEIEDPAAARTHGVDGTSERMRAARLSSERELAEIEASLVRMSERLHGCSESDMRSLITEGLTLEAERTGSRPYSAGYLAQQIERMTCTAMRSVAAGRVDGARSAGILGPLELAIAARDRRSLLAGCPDGAETSAHIGANWRT
ncbi:MAG: hypothetical protein KF847_19875 [Pirellulales bacterium]|nr:hypothetical protein [Pirellulales bacterium]